MKTFKKTLLFIVISISLNAQETILKTEFSIKDFTVENDSIFLIEKRDVKYYNINTNGNTNNIYFIGGYGLKLYNDVANNEIITIANEFQKPVSSLRFYNKKTKEIEQVFYYEKGKSIDALVLPELNKAVLSLSDKKIIVVDYSKKPAFEITHNIPLKAISRKVVFYNNNLYYVTDLGEIYTYNLNTKTKSLIHSCGNIITDVAVFKNHIIYSTINGEIVKYNTNNQNIQKLNIKDNFVLNSLSFEENKLIYGTFKGSILLVNTDNFSISKQWNYHKRSVLKITKAKDNTFYSSSIDKTIKKWKVN